MFRREMLGAVGAGAAGLLAMGGTAQAQEANKYRYRSTLDKTHVDCMDACMACAAVCSEVSHHCLEELKKGQGDREFHFRSHDISQDCGDICSLAADFVARQSPLMGEQCNSCADACKRCGDECEKSRSTVEIMKECVRICRECERACREMARMHHARATSPG
jgi:hypothetical protein